MKTDEKQSVSPEEMVRAALEKAEKDEWNCLITRLGREETENRLADVLVRPEPGRLSGIPIVVKDNICTKGVRTTCGSKMLEHFVPGYSATVVERLEREGAVLIGKSNMDEFGMGSTSESSFFGAVKNPHDAGRVAGGSSGGSAAAVASGIVPMALGTDTGGSIRQPASHCGVYGLKPTYGTVSRYGLVAYASSMDQIGPMAGTLSDLELLYEVIRGADEKDSTSFRGKTGEKTECPSGVEGLRIGIPRGFFSETVEPGVSEQVLRVAEKLAERGAVSEEFDLELTEYAVPTYYIIACAEAGSNLERYDGVKYGYRTAEYEGLHDMYKKTRSEGFGEEVRRRLILGTFVLSHGYYDAYYRKACQVRNRIYQAFRKAFERFDVILTPVAPTVAPRLGELTPDPIRMYLSDLFTVPANLTGVPAISFPCGRVNGLPVGAQLISGHFCEKTLFRVVAEYEK